ncbi:MAG: CehA/McbA family metallohydrolase [Bryobacteraceae bacterium]
MAPVEPDFRSRLARRRVLVLTVFTAALGLAYLWGQEGDPALSARLTIRTEPLVPARVYLFKSNRPFRLSPVDALLPLSVDSFYRERLWTRGSGPVRTLEVRHREDSHFLLLSGEGTYSLPAGSYRVEAYRGTFYAPAAEVFDLRAGESATVTLKLRDWSNGKRASWISSDDHIHLTRSRADDPIYLGWLEAEDLTVGNFLQLQRQADAGVQYAFGPAGEAKRNGFSIRPGHESRCEYFGHVNLLGGRRVIRPLSVGSMYSNAAGAYPFPSVWFRQGRQLGATVGYAHFAGSMPHSTLLMDLALGQIDFLEVLQFGVLKSAEWYELLNAGLRVTGIAGSDFPVPLPRKISWPRRIPLLGPERTLVRATPGPNSYTSWAEAVRKGEAIVTNGPLVGLTLDAGRLRATGDYYTALDQVEIVVDGKPSVVTRGDGTRASLTAEMAVPENACWAAARTQAPSSGEEPVIQAHTNPIYLRKGCFVAEARQKAASRWQAEVDWYRSQPLEFGGDAHRREFFEMADRALAALRQPPVR